MRVLVYIVLLIIFSIFKQIINSDQIEEQERNEIVEAQNRKIENYYKKNMTK